MEPTATTVGRTIVWNVNKPFSNWIHVNSLERLLNLIAKPFLALEGGGGAVLEESRGRDLAVDYRKMAGIILLLDFLKKNPSLATQSLHSYSLFSATVAASAAAASVAAGKPFASRAIFGCVSIEVDEKFYVLVVRICYDRVFMIQIGCILGWLWGKDMSVSRNGILFWCYDKCFMFVR